MCRVRGRRGLSCRSKKRGKDHLRHSNRVLHFFYLHWSHLCFLNRSCSSRLVVIIVRESCQLWRRLRNWRSSQVKRYAKLLDVMPIVSILTWSNSNFSSGSAMYIMNCTSDPLNCQRQGITGYPTLTAFRSLSWSAAEACLGSHSKSSYIRHDYHGPIAVSYLVFRNWVLVHTYPGIFEDTRQYVTLTSRYVAPERRTEDCVLWRHYDLNSAMNLIGNLHNVVY